MCLIRGKVSGFSTVKVFEGLRRSQSIYSEIQVYLSPIASTLTAVYIDESR